MRWFHPTAHRLPVRTRILAIAAVASIPSTAVSPTPVCAQAADSPGGRNVGPRDWQQHVSSVRHLGLGAVAGQRRVEPPPPSRVTVPRAASWAAALVGEDAKAVPRRAGAADATRGQSATRLPSLHHRKNPCGRNAPVSARQRGEGRGNLRRHCPRLPTRTR
jgi:hypothetical protein